MVAKIYSAKCQTEQKTGGCLHEKRQALGNIIAFLFTIAFYINHRILNQPLHLISTIELAGSSRDVGSWLTRVCQGQRGLEAVCKGLARWFCSSQNKMFSQVHLSVITPEFSNIMGGGGGRETRVMVNCEVDT